MKRKKTKRADKMLKTAEFFADRKARADFKAFDEIMSRKRGQKPRNGDEI